jgi:hypothetical protein
MSLKSKVVGAVVLAGICAGVSSVNAANTVTINMSYLGSTTGVSNNAITKMAQNTGTGLLLSATNVPGSAVPTSGLTVMDLTSPTVQGTAGLKNYFAVYADYHPDNPTTDRLYGVGLNISASSKMVPVSSTGLTDNSTAKFVFYNITDDNTGAATWDTFGDLGTNAGDLQGVALYQATVASAYAMNIGTADAISNGDNEGYISGKGVLLGVFAMQFTGTLDKDEVISIATSGSSLTGAFAWWDSNVGAGHVSALPGDPGFTGATYVIPAIPEPASLGVLALGGLALLVKRRK